MSDLETHSHEDTQECFNAWIEHIGLQPWHVAGAFEAIDKGKIDVYVWMHGKEKVIEALQSCKTRSALQALSSLDAAEMEIAKQKLAKPRVDEDEVKRLMERMD